MKKKIRFSFAAIFAAAMIIFVPLRATPDSIFTMGGVVPGGYTVGLKLYSDGLLVIGLSEICSNGKTVSPGKNAGILKGDRIVEIDGTKIDTSFNFGRIIQSKQAAKSTLTVVRDSKELKLEITPAYYDALNEYKIGVWVRDSAAGIGTVTFVMPDGRFAALGHSIADADTDKLIEIQRGEVTGCTISSAVKGEKGTPGELRGILDGGSTGSLTINCEKGIYGNLWQYDMDAQALPIAAASEVLEGEAAIYSNVDSNVVEQYTVNIDRIMHGMGNKDMIIRVTDDRLLEKTGGIVQGM